MIYIKVKANFEDFHMWKKAPKAVAFLKNLHRHIFFVEAKIEVLDDDRELEYFMVQKKLKSIIQTIVVPMKATKSCEMMAETIVDYLEHYYPNRFIEVEVNEDGENGSISNNI